MSVTHGGRLRDGMGKYTSSDNGSLQGESTVNAPKIGPHSQKKKFVVDASAIHRLKANIM